MNQYRPKNKAMVSLLALMLCLSTFAAGQTKAQSIRATEQTTPSGGIIVLGQALTDIACDNVTIDRLIANGGIITGDLKALTTPALANDGVQGRS